jgi:ABC-type bacteriocin/lantibiotic exporter with double-glycine peptidase domain
MIHLNFNQNDLDKLVDIDGSNFSGGQKQRLGIIRTLLSENQIIILDEPTSALDELTELDTIKLINELTLDKTVIYITHKQNVLKYVNRIIKLDKGKIE